jgi:PncC family amidohydrolase
LIASLITREAGSSQVFGSGFVTYSNTAKNSVLGVPEATLIKHGAVSEPVVLAMLSGALEKSGADDWHCRLWHCRSRGRVRRQTGRNGLDGMGYQR